MKNVVFVCVENSCRSQLAEAFGKIHGKHRLNVYSSGSRPSGMVNPKAIASMAELDYDLTQHQSKPLDSLPDIEWARLNTGAITMGCGDECPTLRARHREDWGIPDPKLMNPEEFRKVRALIEDKVKQLLLRV